VRPIGNAIADRVRLSEKEIERVCPIGFIPLAYYGYVDAAYRNAEVYFRLAELDRPDSTSNDTRVLFLPFTKSVRADPRFMRFAARLGLVDYWLDTDRWPDFCSTEVLPYDCKEAALAARMASASAKAPSEPTPPT
jgi:hypothetical protein